MKRCTEVLPFNRLKSENSILDIYHSLLLDSAEYSHKDSFGSNNLKSINEIKQLMSLDDSSDDND